MSWLRLKFKSWRRRPFKRAVLRAYSEGIINSIQLHELLERLDHA